MIVEYHRPDTLKEALSLLAKHDPVTVPLGGGTVINKPSRDPIAVVDLQGLNLDFIENRGDKVILGATVKLSRLVEVPGIQPDIVQIMQHEGTYNLRNVKTIAGTIVSADGRSHLLTSLLALDVKIRLVRKGENESEITIGELLLKRKNDMRGNLIVSVSIPLNARLAYEYVARTPGDLPIVSTALSRWSSGRIRLALGGYGVCPTLALDGSEADGVEIAAKDAYTEAADTWASAEYRQEVAGILAERCLMRIE
jgi:CO/xanthine dehydrogenase FAD-binding subunit